jgi:acyl-CoA-dependent ceramide synthase
MFSWFIARHVLYLVICYSVWAHTPVLLPTGCFTGSNASLTGPFDPPTDTGPGFMYLFEPLWRKNGLVCYDQTVKWSFLSALLFLQGITLCWFGMVVKVAVRVLKGDGAGESRGDDEADGLEDHEEVYEEVDLETEVGVGGLDLRNWEGRSGVKITMATAMGHSDRKELLGRIGFDKLGD